jgi:nicotinamidase-related amidase
MIPSPLFRPLPIDKIRPDNTALLVIDMVNDFVAAGAVMETPGAREIIPTIGYLISWARTHDLAIIFTYEMHRPDHSDYGIELEYDPVHCIEGTGGVKLHDGLDARATDWHLQNKRRYDCFHGTELDLLLRSRRKQNLVCCGVTTHQCVMSTVFSARHRDYRVLLAHDACAGVTPEHHAAAILCMSDVFSYVTDTATICSLWRDEPVT